MPANKNILKVKPASGIRFDIEPNTKYKNNLDSIDVQLLQVPMHTELELFVGPWVNATWAKNPLESQYNGQIENYLRGAIKGEILPSLLETIPLTFLINGISLIEVTHLLRHRQFSFSADCSGDKMWNEKDALVPNSIENSDEFYRKYQEIVDKSKKLYCDMINSKKVSIMDARYILPRCLSTYYFVQCNLRSAIEFIKQRIDKQIQPETDNIIAYKMWLEICAVYPFLKDTINFHVPATNYIKQANTNNASNLYFPDKDSDTFDWNPKSFVYKCTRDKLNGTNKNARNHFKKVMKEIEKEINEL